MKKIINDIKEIIPYILIIIIVLLIRTYVVTPVRVNGISMSPTLLNNELLLLKKYDKSYERFDIVVFNYTRISYASNKTKTEKLVKRIIGVPGDHIAYKDSKLYINGEYIEEDFISVTTNDFDLTNIGYDTIPDGYYFVMGDNRNNSTDSRVIGLINEDDIIGTTSFVLYPFNRFGKIYN